MNKKNIFRNTPINKKEIKNLISWSFANYGVTRTSYLADKLKNLGFEYATKSGISISLEDLRVPPNKRQLIRSGNFQTQLSELMCEQGQITKVERFQTIVGIWIEISELLKANVVSYFKETDSFNSIYIMSFSGARGNLTQVHQLVGMRGMMANPTGDIIEVPIISNFRDGLTITDYIISSYGARKGVVDTALRTADAGYLTRRLVDVAQDVVIRANDCETKHGIYVSKISDGKKILVSLKDRIVGRVLAQTVYSPSNSKILLKSGTIITNTIANYIEKSGIKRIKVRSPLTCGLSRAVCKKCYGWNLAYNKLVGLGEAVGILAAQSIGEPGTQLTMRTFHTGGVFTAKQRQRLVAEFSGTLFFESRLRVLKYRDGFGKTIWLAQNSSYIQLRGFKNEQLKLRIKRGTIIEINHNQIVLKGQTIASLPDQNNITNQEATQTINADSSGEIYIETNVSFTNNPLKNKQRMQNKSILVWILSGQVYSTFAKSKRKKIVNQFISNQTCLAKLKLITEHGGKIEYRRIGKNKINGEIEIYISPLTLNSSRIYLGPIFNDELECILQSLNGKIFHLKNLKDCTLNKPIAESINLNYFSPIGGTINYIFDNPIKTINSNSCIGFLFIPQETYLLNKDTTRLIVQKGDIVTPNTELVDNIFCKTGGLIDLIIKQNVIKEISIRCGKIVKLNRNNDYKKIDQQIFYPGENIFDKIEVTELTYTEVHSVNDEKVLLLRPIIIYDLPKNQNEINHFFNSQHHFLNQINLGFETINEFKYEHRKLIKTANPITLHSTKLIVKSKTKNINQSKLKIRFVKVGQYFQFEVNFSEQFNFNQIIPKNLKNEKILISTFFENEQYIEPYSVIGEIQIFSRQSTYLYKMNDYICQNKRQLLTVTKNDFLEIFIDEYNKKNLFIKEGDFLKIGEYIAKNLKSNVSGRIEKINTNTILVRKAQAFLFSKGAVLYQSSGNFVKKGEIIGILTYQRARTDDIVQGLPRVEAILEGRNFKNASPLIKQPSIVSHILYSDQTCTIYLKGKSSITEVVSIENSPIIRRNQFISMGTPITQQPVNGQTLLDISFKYFREYLSLEEATSRSFGRTQLFLLTSVQAVYRSQGVEISDKHIEVIIRKMTSKVQVTKSGVTKVLPNELLNFGQVKTINKTLKQLKLTPITYIPLLLGITKASLKTDSFLAAASFQDTTRILTEAAIEGKIDWLYGIKESVIAGKTIPVGTGFAHYMNNQNVLENLNNNRIISNSYFDFYN